MCNEAELNRNREMEERRQMQAEDTLLQEDTLNLRKILQDKKYDVYDVAKIEKPLDGFKKMPPLNLEKLARTEKKTVDDWTTFYGIPKEQVADHAALDFVLTKRGEKKKLQKKYTDYVGYTAIQNVAHAAFDNELPQKMDQIITASAQWKKAINENVFLSDREKKIRMVRAMRPYERYIERYRILHRNLPDMPTEYQQFYREYNTMVQESVILQGGENTLLQNDITATAFRTQLKKDLFKIEGKRFESDRLDVKVQEEIPMDDDEQKEGVQAIDEWLVRNMAKTPGKCAFVSRILAMPARERLFLYYIVSEKRRHVGNRLDISVSQCYVPSLNRFKKQMVASWVRVFKRIGGNHLYWDKLGDALRILERNRDEMDLYVVPGAREQRRREFENRKAKRMLDATAEEQVRLKEEYSLDRTRERSIVTVIARLNQLRLVMMRDRDNKPVIEELKRQVASGFEEFKTTELGYYNFIKERLQTEGTSQVKGTEVVEDDMKLPGTAIAHTKGSSSVMMGFFEDYDANAATLTALPITNMISSVAVITSLIGFLNSFVNTCQTAGAASGTERAVQAVQLLGGLATLTQATSKTLEGFGTIMQSLAPCVDTTKNVTQYAGVAAIGTTCAIGVAKGASFINREHHINEAMRRLGRNARDTREKRIIRLSERIAENKGKQALLTLGTAAVFTMAELFVASAGFGAGIFFMTPIIAGLISKRWENNEEIGNEVIEQEYSLNKWLERREREWRAANPQARWSEKERETYRKQLLEEVAAMMGDASIEQLLTRATRKSAEYLYEKMFYDDKGEFISHERYHSEPALHDKVKPYKELIRSFGCSVKHGTTIEDSKPQLAVLIKKMKA